MVKICLALQEMGLRYTGIHQTIQPFVEFENLHVTQKSRNVYVLRKGLRTSLVAGTVDRNLLANVGGHGFDPDWKIPHASEQLPCVHNY